MHLSLVACSGAGGLEQPTTLAATQSRLVKPGMAQDPADVDVHRVLSDEQSLTEPRRLR